MNESPQKNEGLIFTDAAARKVGELIREEGNPKLKSMGPLAFAPDGILLVADTKGAAVVAIATGDTKPAPAKPAKPTDEPGGQLAPATG